MDLAAYSDEHGLEYPANYVLSQWGDNRMYNYFVSGKASSYRYAQGNYVLFITGTDGKVWYDRIGDRRGFVVTTDDAVLNASTLGTRLHRNYGSRSGDVSGLGHYRLIATSGNGSYKAFAVVLGAVIEGTAQPNATVTVRTGVSVDGTTFPYVRQATANSQGAYSVRVAYPGTYRTGNRTVTVSESVVRNGSTVSAGD